MAQPRKSIHEIREILSQVKFLDWDVRLLEKGDGYLLQWVFDGEDADKPGQIEKQFCRKWYVSPYSTETEIVETAWKAVWVAMMHETRENFYYKGRRIYSPHYDVNDRIAMCDEGTFDMRIPIGKKGE